MCSRRKNSTCRNPAHELCIGDCLVFRILCRTEALLATGKVQTCTTPNNHSMCNKIACLPIESLPRLSVSRLAGLLAVREVFLIDARHHARAETSLRNAHRKSARFLRAPDQKNTSTQTAAVPMQRSNLISICVHSGKALFTRATSMHELSSLIILIYTIWHHVPRRRTQIHKATVLSQKSHLTLESRSQLRRTIQRSAKPKLVAEHNLQLYNQSLCYVACSLFLLQMLFSNKHLVRLANMRTGNLVRKVLLFRWSSISSKDMSRHPGALFLR